MSPSCGGDSTVLPNARNGNRIAAVPAWFKECDPGGILSFQPTQADHHQGIGNAARNGHHVARQRTTTSLGHHDHENAGEDKYQADAVRSLRPFTK